MSRALALLCVTGILGCGKSTQVQRVALKDGIRWSNQAGDGWTKREFDDRAWSAAAADTSLPGRAAVCARRNFDLGPAFTTYRTLSLDLEAAGRWVAWLNGVRMQGGNGASATLDVPAGLLRARANVLAIELHPTMQVTSLRIAPRLAADRRREDLRVTLGPYLLAPAPDSITVAWETGVATPSSLLVAGRRFDGGNGSRHLVRVDRLEPSTRYRYHVETGATSTEEAELRTAPRSAERVRFVVYGDNRTNGDVHRRVVEAIAGESADFLLNTGDLVAAVSEDEWRTFFDIEYPLLLTTPIYPALGNHETYQRGGESFDRLFPLVDDPLRFGGRVYAADYGALHVAVLDSNGDLEAQARWLERDLSAAEERGAQHSFVMLHWGPFSSRQAERHGSNSAARTTLVPVARAHHVDAIFAGHDHLYERGSSDGLTYFVTGGGGAPLVRAESTEETALAVSRHHYLVVDVSGGEVRVQAKDPEGVVFDEWASANDSR